MSDSVQPHRQQPTKLPLPWDSPGKNTGVGCHFLLHCMKVKSESEVAQSCPTLSDPMDCSPPGSSVHGTFQARVPEWGAIAFSRVSCYVVYLHKRILIFRQTLESEAFKSIFTVLFICKVATAAAKSLQSCPTLCNPIDSSQPGSFVPGILQARTLEWVAISFSNA